MNRLLMLAAAATLPCLASADEGMWTFDNPPSAAIKSRYGVELTRDWLDRVRGATLRLESGCTASFVSPTGLILTNHHCAEDCIAENSSAETDRLGKGFLAATPGEELRCQGEAASVLIRTEDVTEQVRKATAGLDPAKAVETRRAELTRLEQACEEASAKDRATGPLKCEAVTLYQGGQSWIYAYKRYDDVRLVFAPEKDIGAFGGDVDNFQFPRWSLDMAILRAYEDGKPAKTPNRLQFDWKGAAAGEPVFVSGHPGTTQRLMTLAELDAQRDVTLPFWLLRFSELRGRMIQFGKGSEESERRATAYLNTIENSIKVRRKQQDALNDDALFGRKAAEEAALAKALAGGPDADAYERIAKAQQVHRDIHVRHAFLEGGAGFNSELFVHARTLVRAAAERAKPNAERLRPYTDARLPAIERALRAETPYYADLDQVRLSFSLERMREWLGPDDPLVRRIFGRESPDSLAARLIAGSKLADPAERMALYAGGQAAIDASDDAMIRLAAAVDPEAAALRKRMEDEVEGPTRQAQEAIAAARFATLGTDVYPDATFTLRLSYGAVDGWVEQGAPVAPFTTLEAAFERSTGRPPFRMPESWLDKAHALPMDTPFNFVATLDIVGGNSGSPIVNARGDIVGLAFDGNIHSIAGGYGYDVRNNRAIGVDVRIMRLALEEVYGAKSLLAEMDRRR
ncbi:MAG: S46 family peptidase [Steroidobacteraceae bacterium]|jgi:hypothetical protein|nr:S46 family peptidase [Steroidobacteraceae bacterium]